MIQVVLRIKPSSTPSGGGSLVCGADGKSATFDADGDATMALAFDGVLPSSSSQNQVYTAAGATAVASVLDGVNATVIAYGATGSGKTYSLFGPAGQEAAGQAERGRGLLQCPSSELGVIPRTFDDLFSRSQIEMRRVQTDVEVSFIQMYNERCTDLVTGLQLKVRHQPAADGKGSGDFTTNATFVPVAGTEDVMALLHEGLLRRATAATGCNSQSSRSHALLTARVMRRDEATGVFRVTYLHLADLAGCERQGRTAARGALLHEGIMINKSLLALGKVVEALSAGALSAAGASTHSKGKGKGKGTGKGGAGGRRRKTSAYIPYRDSVLTKLLKGALGGNARTTLLVCVSPDVEDRQHTLSTLRFALRAQSVLNRPVIQQGSDLSVRDLRAAVQRAATVLDAQKRAIRRKERDVAIHRQLAQQILTRISDDSPLLRDVYRVLPMLRRLPRVREWGDIFIPEFVMSHIFMWSGVRSMATASTVCKEWNRTLCQPSWDEPVWRAMAETQLPDLVAEKEAAQRSNTGGKRPGGGARKDGGEPEHKTGDTAACNGNAPSHLQLAKLSWRVAMVAWGRMLQRRRRKAVRDKFQEAERGKIPRGGLILLAS